MLIFNTIKQKLFGLTIRILNFFSPEFARKSAIKRVTKNYDMMSDPDEEFFSKIYLYYIRKRIKDVFNEKKINILDAGCGQGRLSIPLAKDGNKITGVDFTREALKKAKEYASENNLDIEFILGDIGKDINKTINSKFDCVICTEVLYMIKDYKKVIDDLIKILHPGGLIFISIRPRLYYVKHKLINGKINESYDILLNKRVFINNGFLNCNSKEEIEEILKEKGVFDIVFNGIGVVTGIKGDPQAYYSNPSIFNLKEQQLLFEMELLLGSELIEHGRYMLLSGIKKNE
ncbi:MAG: methyltransferase domain-containing protein [Syntrophorhabdaceae bacterium]|nr:methyltransferase domain-containing protein [Syntrophorhabdaceae bacterium]